MGPSPYQLSSRAAREDDIRRHSEAYGLRFCTDHAHRLGTAIATWRDGGDASEAEAITLRIYNRESNEMSTATLREVLDRVVCDSTGRPQRLVPTPFGQVVLSPSMYISTIIYHTITAAWCLSRTSTA